MPRRSELDPGALLPALPDLVIVDVAMGDRPGTRRFTFRLAGTRVDDRLGVGLTGRTVETSLFGDTAAAVQHQYETVVAERRLLFCSHRVVVGGSRYVEYDWLVAPLSGPDETQIVALVTALDFTCAYSVEEGRPHSCCGPATCDRTDLCLPPAFGGKG